MDRLQSRIRTDTQEFHDNQSRMTRLVEELRDRLASSRQGGGARHIERHREQGKLPVRERIDGLLDPDSPFLELSPLAGWEMYDNDAPGAGIVTGIGRVSGREVLIVANDASVKGGTYYPITVKSRRRRAKKSLPRSSAERMCTRGCPASPTTSLKTTRTRSTSREPSCRR